MLPDTRTGLWYPTSRQDTCGNAAPSVGLKSRNMVRTTISGTHIHIIQVPISWRSLIVIATKPCAYLDLGFRILIFCETRRPLTIKPLTIRPPWLVNKILDDNTRVFMSSYISPTHLIMLHTQIVYHFPS